MLLYYGLARSTPVSYYHIACPAATAYGHTTIYNTIESYGRTKTTDPHREHYSTKKGAASETSLPLPLKMMGSNVWPRTPSHPEGVRLVVGTLTCNILVTSSLRLDTAHSSSLGRTTLLFPIPTDEVSMTTAIFLDKESLRAGILLAKDTGAKKISSSNVLFQLRHLRSKFDSPATFILCRASSFITRSHLCHPYSISTLASFDSYQGWISLRNTLQQNHHLSLEQRKDGNLEAPGCVIDTREMLGRLHQRLTRQHHWLAFKPRRDHDPRKQRTEQAS
ncbi:hypothetical protein EDD21DRAFT_360431 [Dissophora ornata]|nr:hypothetical protein EDD21DRAFT_360431 [Dissophora ornata]